MDEKIKTLDDETLNEWLRDTVHVLELAKRRQDWSLYQAALCEFGELHQEWMRRAMRRVQLMCTAAPGVVH